MAIKRSDLYGKIDITQKQTKVVENIERIIDSVLEVNRTYADIALCSLTDPAVRQELERIYVESGWKVQFAQLGNSPFICITVS